MTEPFIEVWGMRGGTDWLLGGMSSYLEVFETAVLVLETSGDISQNLFKVQGGKKTQVGDKA